jgi:6-phosphogluconolactonase
MVAGLQQELYELANIETLSRRAAALIVAAGWEAVAKRGRFRLVLTGGRTVRGLYRYLAANAAEPGFKEVLRQTDFFLGDERWVPEDHPDSNGGMARRLLLEPAGIAAQRIFMIPTGGGSPAADAARYEETLRLYFGSELAGGAVPALGFDLVLLGLGEDGHVASLFPGSEALRERERWVTTSMPSNLAPAVARITMTLPLLNRGGEVVLLVRGAEKRTIARTIMAAPREAAGIYPAALVRAVDRRIWLLADH